MKFYISGPISGDPDYKRKFRVVSEKLRQDFPDDVVLNPAVLPEDMRPADYMAICLPMMLRADIVFLLPGWESSAGAQIEKQLAEYAGISVLRFPSEWIPAQAGGMT